MKWMKYTLIVTSISSLLLTAACSPFVENNVVEEIAPVIFWYVSKGDEKKFKISTTAPPLTKEKQQMFSIQVNLLKQGGKNFNLIYFREMKLGQLRMVLINEEIAKKGIMNIVNTLLIDPDTSERLFLVVVKGDFEKYLQSHLNEKENMEYYLYRMLKHYEDKNQGELTTVNLHEFKKMLYTPFSDPILPIFKADKNNFQYLGTAFFKGDKLQKSITKIDDQIFQLVDIDHYLKYLVIPDLDVVLGHVRAKVHYNINSDYSTLSVKVKMDGRLEEYHSDVGYNQNDLKKLQSSIENYMEKQTKKLYQKIQQEKIDPLRIGTTTLRPFKKPLSEKKWHEYWSKMKIKMDYEVVLTPLPRGAK